MTAKRRGSSIRSPARSAALAIAALLAVAASGCALLTPRPPDSVSQTVDQAVAEIRAMPGVASVTSNLSPYDFKDGGPLSNPEAWSASIAVEAEPDASDLPVLADAVAHSVTGLAGSMRVDGRLELSVGANAVATTILLPVEGGSAHASSAGELVATVEQLASVDTVANIQLGSRDFGPQVTVEAPGSVFEAAAAVRGLPAFGAGDLETVSVLAASKENEQLTTQIMMDASSPSGELLTFLTGLAGQPGVASIGFGGVQGPPQSTPEGGWRPALSVGVDDAASQAAVVSALAGFTGPQGVDGTVPRASFEVKRFSKQDGHVSVTGFVGLPVGSADPGDGRQPPPVAAPADPSADGSSPPPLTIETPDEQAARLASDQLVIAQFLDAAGDAAGIRGTPTTQTTSCEVNGVAAGQKVTGSVVIPVFEVADTADDAYAAVTKAWAKAGLGSTETVMGRKYFSTSAPDAVVRRASIRGTTDGLSIMVEGCC